MRNTLSIKQRGDEMEAQDKPMYLPPMPDVTAALLDFAQLSQRGGLAMPNEAGLIAIKLLERLLTLCNAQRGTVLLTTQHFMGSEQSSLSALSPRKMFRSFALYGMSDEEAIAMAANFVLDGPDIQVPSDESGWLLWRLPVTAAFPPGQITPYMQEHVGHALLPLYAITLLCWTGGNNSARVDKIEHARALLPRITSAFGAAILNVLQAERIHELEMASDRKALREMELFKAELLATVSHELRSPLASIKGYAATLLRHERRIAREERHEFLLAINEASDRLEVVVNRLLEVSQLETGTITIERVPVNLEFLAREAILVVQERLLEKQNGQGFSSKTDDGADFTFVVRLENEQGERTSAEPIILADRMRLREVLDNLLENAVNYSPEGGTIEVILRPVFAFVHGEPDDDGHERVGNGERAGLQPLTQQPMMEIVIRDRGVGIPAGQLRAIFDRFHRVDTRLTREVNGLGLGLAICKHIIELHNGMIWAESEFGNGSTFHVWLPLEREG
jgi:signal transduction histidine kinase